MILHLCAKLVWAIRARRQAALTIAAPYYDWLGAPSATPPPPVISYPTPSAEPVHSWLSEQLLARTGQVLTYTGIPAARTVHGVTVAYSTRQLHRLLHRAESRDYSLTTDELIGLRTRGMA